MTSRHSSFPSGKPERTGRLSKPAWSLAVTDARENPAAARNLKSLSDGGDFTGSLGPSAIQRTLKTLPAEPYYRTCIAEGRHISHRRGNAPSWALIELEDLM